MLLTPMIRQKVNLKKSAASSCSWNLFEENKETERKKIKFHSQSLDQ